MATTGARAWVEPLLDHAFGSRFHVVITGTEVPDFKPNPAVYLEVLNRTGCPAERAVAQPATGRDRDAVREAAVRLDDGQEPFRRSCVW